MGGISGDAPEQSEDFKRSLSRDFWLTNSLGSYVATSELGINSRKYHSLFAFTPDGNPANSAILLSKLEETAIIGEVRIPLSSNCYPGAVHPDGWKRIAKFEFDGVSAKWEYSLHDKNTGNDFTISKEVWMAHHSPAAFIRYSIPEMEKPAPAVAVEAVPLVSCRPIHSIGAAKNIRFSSSHDAAVFTSPHVWSLSIEGGEFTAHQDNYYRMQYPLDAPRGDSSEEDLFTPGKFTFSLNRGTSALICARAALSGVPEGLLNRLEHHKDLALRSKRLVMDFEKYNGFGQMPHLSHLLLASDSFFTMLNGRRSIVAGFPYFGVWGRDMLLSLPGAAIYTGRHAIAREAISGILSFEKDGLLPNHFDNKGKPVYEAADVSLLAILAVWHLEEEGGLREEDRAAWWGSLKRIAAFYLRGNRLVTCGEDRLISLNTPRSTWMDAQIDGKPVTPREGRRVEINALWVFSLRYLSNFAAKCGDEGTADDLDDLHSDASRSFSEFFNQYAGYFDDGIGPTDGSLRPNQLFALALPHLPVTPPQARQALSHIREHLLTPYGLRTLAPNDRKYVSHYGGSQPQRDAAYHNGAAWPWIIGLYVDATLRHQPERSGELSRPVNHLVGESRGAHGTLAEVYDPTEFTPAGCPSQAWSVCETLRAAVRLYRQKYSHGRLPSLLAERH